MSDTTLTIRIPDEVAAELRRIADEEGVSAESVAASMTERNVRAIADAKSFFAERAKRADDAAYDRVFAPGRTHGEPPRAGDEAE